MSVGLDGAARVLKGEMHRVLSLLRGTHFGSRARFEREVPSSSYSPLVQALLALQSQDMEELEAVDPLVWLTPFLDVIASRDTNALVTGAALGAVLKALKYGWVRRVCCV
jgi:hypothetical protein